MIKITHVNIWGGPPKWNLFIKIVYSYMFKLQSSSKYFPFDAIYLSRRFSHGSNQCLNLSILMPFSASAVFCFPSSTSAKWFPSRTFFIQGNKKKVDQGKIMWIERVGQEDHAVFDQKPLNTQRSVGWCTQKSPTMKWANVLKDFSKKIHWSGMQPLTTTPANRWIPKTLT